MLFYSFDVFVFQKRYLKLFKIWINNCLNSTIYENLNLNIYIQMLNKNLSEAFSKVKYLD